MNTQNDKQNAFNAPLILIFLAIFAAGLGLGFYANGKFMSDNGDKTVDGDTAEILYWVAPMDGAYRRDKPGKSPMGMDLLPVYASSKTDDEAVVSISAEVENNLGLRTAKVANQPLYQTIITVGSIAFSDDEITHIHSRTEGWIEKLNINSVGSRVSKGDVLFELYSPEFVNAQEEFVSVLSANNRRMINAAKRRLRLLDFTEAQIKRLQRTRKVLRRVEVYAPHDGVVSTLNVREGMFIKPSIEIMAVGDLATVWVVAEVFERQAGWLKVGQKVHMTVSSFVNQSWLGQVQYIYPEFDRKSRSARVRISFDNADLLLKPNMVAQLEIQAGNNTPRLLVPSEAVIRTENKQRVVKQVGDGEYRSVWVKTGIESNGFTEILSGLYADDTVVVSAQFLIDSESNIDAELLRMSDVKKPTKLWVEAEIEHIDRINRRITVNHEEITGWGKPAMKMTLKVVNTLKLQHLSEGGKYTLQFQQFGDDVQVSAMKMHAVVPALEDDNSHQQHGTMTNHDDMNGMNGMNGMGSPGDKRPAAAGQGDADAQ